jgi:HSP20 family protein
MAIVRWRRWNLLDQAGPWDLLDEVASLRRDVERAFTRWQSGDERSFLPATDVVTKDKDIIVKMELPGLDPEKDLDIKVEGDTLVVSGRRSEEREVKDENYQLRERRSGSFYRSFPLPEGVTSDSITAAYDNGILELTLAGAAQISRVESKRIEVKTGKEAKSIETKAA